MEDYAIKFVSLYLRDKGIKQDPETWFFNQDNLEQKVLDVSSFIYHKLPEEKRSRQIKEYIVRTLAGHPKWNKVK